MERDAGDGAPGAPDAEAASTDGAPDPAAVLRRKAGDLYDRICAAAPSKALSLSPLTAS
jgi:hypothetical protein